MQHLFEHKRGNVFSLIENSDSEGSRYYSGMRKDSARPVGTIIMDATVSVMGHVLRLDTPKGYVEIVLTPEQISEFKLQHDDLK